MAGIRYNLLRTKQIVIKTLTVNYASILLNSNIKSVILNLGEYCILMFVNKC
jgi:hypothetical protein